MCAGKDTGLMIIKLRKYNSAEELLIGRKNVRLWGWELIGAWGGAGL